MAEAKICQERDVLYFRGRNDAHAVRVNGHKAQYVLITTIPRPPNDTYERKDDDERWMPA